MIRQREKIWVLPDEATMPAKYTFYQDYNMVTQGKPAGAIKDFIEFSHSAEGKKIIESMRHIPAGKCGVSGNRKRGDARGGP